ncbi:tumor necrosis factor receptor type 1-associated DEATH domain protein isoform X2 [Ambystoma mexicanum]|uniref:tumor necrosis factor receptor type 1-associated DEATH domain protein isoform X2 n=1 Tax=Ambystoma mexicanum TaxID=8296 RepID=UPI0037E8D10F
MTDCLFTMLSTLSASSNPGPLLSGGDVQFSNSEVDASSTVWVGSAFLFIQCTSDKIDLSCCYQNAMQKPKVFSALRLVLTGSSVGGVNAICILKVYCSDHQLIVYLKFNDQEICQRFLQNYRNGLLQREMQSQLQVALSLIEVPLLMELKVGNEKLDGILDDEERCLQYINKEKPDRLPDEEIAELEESLKSLNCQPEKSTENPQMKKHSLPHEPKRSLSSESYEQLRVTFVFQNQEFVDRPLTTEDHLKFSKMVGRKWKHVGRYLQKTCRALRDPVIDNLSYEFEKEGLYEQAYQMLLRFIQSEGKKATLHRLVTALMEASLTSLAEELLGIQQNEEDPS